MTENVTGNENPHSGQRLTLNPVDGDSVGRNDGELPPDDVEWQTGVSGFECERMTGQEYHQA